MFDFTYVRVLHLGHGHIVQSKEVIERLCYVNQFVLYRML